MARLDGTWTVRRVGGLLPPLLGMRKEIRGERGLTILGPLRMPFEVRGEALHYEPPFRGLVDLLVLADDDHARGRATFRGRVFGRFELARIGR